MTNKTTSYIFRLVDHTRAILDFLDQAGHDWTNQGHPTFIFASVADQSQFGELWIHLATDVDELATQSIKPNRFIAPRGSPAASAHAAAVISESI